MIRAAGAIMAGKDISVKKYVVRLSVEEREQLETLIRKGKGPARRLLKARILLKADISDAGDGWSDNKIIVALDTSASMVYRVRNGGRRVRGSSEPKTACDAVGLAHIRWREGGQADRLGLLRTATGIRTLDVAIVGEQGRRTGIVDRASDSTIGRTLKKIVSNRIAGSAGSSRRRPTAPL